MRATDLVGRRRRGFATQYGDARRSQGSHTRTNRIVRIVRRVTNSRGAFTTAREPTCRSSFERSNVLRRVVLEHCTSADGLTPRVVFWCARKGSLGASPFKCRVFLNGTQRALAAAELQETNGAFVARLGVRIGHDVLLRHPGNLVAMVRGARCCLARNLRRQREGRIEGSRSLFTGPSVQGRHQSLQIC